MMCTVNCFTHFAVSSPRPSSSLHCTIAENPDPSVGVKDIILNEERNVDEKSGRPVVERLVFQIDYNAGTWRKLRRKALLK